MKMLGQMGILITTIIMMLVFFESSNAVEYRVGGDFGWNTPPNATFYSEWASSKTFQIGDSVLFNTSENQGIVSLGLVANLKDYRNCAKPGIIYTGKGKSELVVGLSRGSQYFTSNYEDQCKRGTKVIMTVGSPTKTSPFMPNRASNLSSMSSSGVVVVIILYTFLVALFNYF